MNSPQTIQSSAPRKLVQLAGRREVLSGIGLALVTGLTHGCRTSAGSAPVAADFLFEHVTLVPMTDGTVLPERAVVVRDGIISQILSQSSAHAIRARQRIDGRGLYLMPALADMHVHVEGEPERDFPLYLANGITTVRNMSARDYDHVRIRADVQSGKLLGPRYLVSGPSLSDRNLRRVEDVRPMLDLHLARNYDFVKVHGTLAPDVYDVLIRGARERGLKVSGHVQQNRPLGESLRMDSIEHAEEFLHVPGRNVLESPEHALAAAWQIAASGIYVTPTLVVFDAISAYLDQERFAALRRRPELRYLPAERLREWLDADRNPYRSRITNPGAITRLSQAVPLLQRFTSLLNEEGVPLLLGTDAAGALVPGFSLHDELSLLVASGLTALEALRTGTVEAARFLGEEAVAGTVEVGKRAELVLIAGNPLVDIRNAARVRGVLSQGRWHDSADLAAMLHAITAKSASTTSAYAL